MPTTPKKSDVSTTDDAGQDEVQARFDEANKKGYFGTTPDETPNENYTLQGVAANKPTPETTRAK